MKILINDHAGHPFPVQLSRSLASRGHFVLHTFTRDLQTPRGIMRKRATDPFTFQIEPLVLSRSFDRYGLVRRFKQELELGLRLVHKLIRFRPDILISAQTPLGTQAILVNECRKRKIPFVFWLQDLLGVGIYNSLKKKMGFPFTLAGKFYINLEKRLLRKSQAVVVISEDFIPNCHKAGVNENKIHVIHNWAPIEDLPVLNKKNNWAFSNGLDSTFNFIYSGTLGMKHNPGLLEALAESIKGLKNVRLVVISEGLGAEWLTNQKKKKKLNNLMILSFQPFSQVAQMQAAADVLIAILEPDAGIFAVPSKVLTYMCAKRPLLLAVPLENLAARIVDENGAGMVVSPCDTKRFLQSARILMKDENLRSKMAERARTYAETHFDMDSITVRFERILLDLVS